ncbi:MULTISPECIES: hypothetical protein [unclassified Mesorhizobium]|uniref:hypothetical protein n=1 Tax=unclassified Mesorhizobium TaxID=325217 RepID=UPI000493E3D5|nr:MULTISPECIES: hypothetical protein [Mesorhizobium]QIA24689.1 hypothetical protein A9K68_024980 [Mesorhizobium sp. AA22]RWM75544.1 MAG: hypothetical protein EOR82_02535 [Mesorhizobium sp.]TIO20675.1 MAG: hypothetical protein E5X83_32285 [Mesorhizobium sp.]TJV61489.1 MAG: hypothetical protein E5X82_11850 [Mesorhizobium sp.]
MPMRHPADIAIYPNDLEMLQRVFIRHCTANQCSMASTMAHGAASELISLFQAGIEDEAELDLILSRRSQPFRKAG